MKKGTIVLLSVLGVIVFVGLWFAGSYNGLVRMDEGVNQAWAQVENVYQRRLDLIPNLVETVKGYAAHESAAFENVSKARTAAMSATAPAEKGAAENMLSGALKSLFAVAEAYPDLKANQNFLHLQQQLGDTEDKIQAARRFYNGTVMALNTAEQTFPGNTIAGMFGFRPADFFELAEGEAAAEAPIKVSF